MIYYRHINNIYFFINTHLLFSVVQKKRIRQTSLKVKDSLLYDFTLLFTFACSFCLFFLFGSFALFYYFDVIFVRFYFLPLWLCVRLFDFFVYFHRNSFIFSVIEFITFISICSGSLFDKCLLFW